ncbi:MAG TPA: 50S ribosomal protein L25/general stress protein Ctc [Geminicoccaceae bacterium]
MAETITFAAERRETAGTGPARALRRAGKIPAIVYGGHEKPLQVALTFKEVKRQVTTNARFFSSVVELDLDGEKVRVLPREAQLHPVTDDPLHVDFMRAEAGALVTVGVPVRFINEQQAPGLKRGGVLNIVRREVELLCPADRIPAEIVADLSGLDINESLHISAVQLPEGVRPTITDRDFTIASIKPPSTEVEEPTPGTETDQGND